MSQPWLLHIETAVEGSSVALSQGSELIGAIICPGGRKGSKHLGTSVKGLLEANGLKTADLSAIAVCIGPGSYTGLRIGISMAKGMSFASGVPLLGINSLEALASVAKQCVKESAGIICSLVDARRMEVYQGIYTWRDLSEKEPIKAEIVDGGTYGALLSSDKVLFVGNAVEKVQPLYAHDARASFLHHHLNAEDLVLPASLAYQKGRLSDPHSLSPAYVKDYIAGNPSKKLDNILHSR